MNQNISYLTAECLAAGASLRHGFFTRQGGVSSGIFTSLNCGLGSGDSPENVRHNRDQVAAALCADALAGVHQVHGRAVHVIRTPEDAELRPQADGLVTALPGIGLSVLSADCAPILFADARAKIIGAAHAGWKGALAGITDAVIDAMERMGAQRRAIAAAIGPCISQSAYEVGADFELNYLNQEPASAVFFKKSALPDKRQFALAEYVAARLARAGIGPVQNLGLCTYQDETRFFSFRRTTHRGETDYGRGISAISLRP
ncbi:MAG: polyphenol oxidase [Alphaproteobacteria bacterium]|nr:polyphenol oxidase [Alphaproteobacteria bacterium]